MENTEGKNVENDLRLLNTLVGKEILIGGYVGVIKKVEYIWDSYRITVHYEKSDIRALYDYKQVYREGTLGKGERFPRLSVAKKGNPNYQIQSKIEPYTEPKLSAFYPKKNKYNSTEYLLSLYKEDYKTEWEEYMQEWTDDNI